jgi:hypothetical protein
MKLGTTLIAAALGCCFALSANAAVVTFTGSTAGGPTYDRLDLPKDPATLAESLGGPSSTGTAVNYSTYTFSIATAGTYSFTTAGAFDTMNFLYSGVFNPAAPSAGALKGNDDLVSGIGTSGFSLSLAAGTYSFVTTSFLNGQGGVFSNSINGAGPVTTIAAPTPATPNPKLLTFTGSTTGATTYNRADEDSTLSTDGDAVAFKTFQFTVGAVGTYDILSNGDFDTFVSLYGGSFDPNNPLANLLVGNDDAFNGTDFVNHVSAFGFDLLPGITYTVVTSAFGDGEAGFFSNAIVGPGAVTAIGAAAVPEPDALALLLSGFGVMAFVARRRKTSGAPALA